MVAFKNVLFNKATLMHEHTRTHKLMQVEFALTI